MRGATGARLAFGPRPVLNLFRQLAVLDEGSERKRFTPAVFELDRPALAALLRGLFTADGTVANYGEKSQYVSLASPWGHIPPPRGAPARPRGRPARRRAGGAAASTLSSPCSRSGSAGRR